MLATRPGCGRVFGMKYESPAKFQLKRTPRHDSNDKYYYICKKLRMKQQEIDEKYMRLALNEARKAFDEQEVPIGAVVVAGGAVVGRGHNLVETLSDPTAHAEMQALTAAASTLGGKYLQECTLYVTVEPCIMCAGAIGWAQVGRVVWGADDPKKGYRRYSEGVFHPKTTVVRGVLAEECETLMTSFFAGLRE